MSNLTPATAAPPAPAAQNEQHTSETFRPLLKKLALSFDLGLLPGSTAASSAASTPLRNSTASLSHGDPSSSYPSKFRPPGRSLSRAELKDLFEHMSDLNFTSSHANAAQIGAALTSLRMTGLDRDPVALAVASQIFLQSCIRIPQDGSERSKGKERQVVDDEDEGYEGLLDIVGTGGDGQDTFNVSTTAAMVASGVPGVRVCKHGAKASSSTSGSVDLLLSLGIPLAQLPSTSIPSILPTSSFCFLYAQLFHPSLGPLAPIRRALSFPTIFNVLGPLINPAQPRRCVLGVHSYALGRTFAEALRQRGNVERAWVVCGREGLDEISCEGPTDVWELTKDGEILEFSVEPTRDFGLPSHPLKHVGSFSSDENASIVLRLLSDQETNLPLEPLSEASPLTAEETQGPSASQSGTAKKLADIPAGAHLRAIADYTLIQAAALLYVAGKGSSLKRCVELARESMRSGQARAALETFKTKAEQEIRADESRKEEERRATELRERSQNARVVHERQSSGDRADGKLQDSFAYYPNPSRDANVGTD